MATCEMRIVQSGKDLQLKGTCEAQKNGEAGRTHPSCYDCCLRWLWQQTSVDQRSNEFSVGQTCGADVDTDGKC